MECSSPWMLSQISSPSAKLTLHTWDKLSTSHSDSCMIFKKVLNNRKFPFTQWSCSESSDLLYVQLAWHNAKEAPAESHPKIGRFHTDFPNDGKEIVVVSAHKVLPHCGGQWCYNGGKYSLLSKCIPNATLPTLVTSHITNLYLLSILCGNLHEDKEKGECAAAFIAHN